MYFRSASWKMTVSPVIHSPAVRMAGPLQKLVPLWTFLTASSPAIGPEDRRYSQWSSRWLQWFSMGRSTDWTFLMSWIMVSSSSLYAGMITGHLNFFHSFVALYSWSKLWPCNVVLLPVNAANAIFDRMRPFQWYPQTFHGGLTHRLRQYRLWHFHSIGFCFDSRA